MSKIISVNGIVKRKAHSKLNPSKCFMLNDLELYNVHGGSAEIENGLFSVKYKL